MKRVTIVVPDTMTHTWGGHMHSDSEEVEVDKASILLSLVTDDYHINWYFHNPKSIFIESIEDIQETS